jgi:hypothetical protein
VTAEILQRYLEMEASLLLGWLMKFPGADGKDLRKDLLCSLGADYTDIHGWLGVLRLRWQLPQQMCKPMAHSSRTRQLEIG